ncbi:PEP/pyruvate-binding domain-containing protein [Nocardia sp. NPDC004568]|uniref:PEP/pyruvate-binding domain-containing protein n=1 Tax=Nocardia sp. NPDC004568 TaxID=3154551 RepID=UPI00339FC9DF
MRESAGPGRGPPADGGLHDRILAAAARAVADRPETWTVAALEIAGLIADQAIPEAVAGEIQRSYAHLGGVAVAVRRREPALRPGAAADLARIAVRIEKLYGRPMDIEWALRDQHLFIVQARPITALPESAPATTGPTWDRRSVEMHVYDRGGHGFAEGPQGLPCDSWLGRYLDWVRSRVGERRAGSART